MNYYDLDEILSEEIKIPITFIEDAINLGYLNTTGISEDIKAGTQLELPYWLAIELYDKNLIEINYPNYYGDKYRQALRSDTVKINLRELCPYYFNIGKNIGLLLHDNLLIDLLRRVLCNKVILHFQKAFNTPNQDFSDVYHDLTGYFIII